MFSYCIRRQRGITRIRPQHAGRAAVDQNILPSGLTAANLQRWVAVVGL